MARGDFVKIRFVTLITATLALAACGAAEQVAPAYVPGKPVVFPVDTISYLASLGKMIQDNCHTDDAVIEKVCISRLENRMRDCAENRPSVLQNLDHAKRVGDKYLKCIMPKPICKGIEIHNEQQFGMHCKVPS